MPASLFINVEFTLSHMPVLRENTYYISAKEKFENMFLFKF